MRVYVAQTELEQGEKLRKQFKDIIDWYQTQYSKYNHIFQSEMDLELYQKELLEITSDYEQLDYTFSFDAIMTPFCIADFLQKHILSTFSYGPENIPGIIQFSNNFLGKSWFQYKGDAVAVTELLKEYFKLNNIGQDIELSILLEERFIRSNLTHTGSIELCMSIIRFYNVIRKMILFMDNELEATLPEFLYPETISCDVQALASHFDMSNIENCTSILIVGSLHDIPAKYLKYLANLPWNIVVDFDSYGGFGGLKAEANSATINDRILDNHTTGNIAIRDNYIEWFNCGDYINPINNQSAQSGQSKLRAMFPLRNYAHPGNSGLKFFVWLRQRFDEIFRGVKNVQNPVSILYLYHDAAVLKEIVNKAEEHLTGVSYSISAVYYWSEDRRRTICNDCYQDDIREGIDYSDRFAIFPSDLKSFFAKTIEYFPELSSKAVLEENLLPSNDGDRALSVNLKTSLEKYFDVVYTSAGHEKYSIASEMISLFHKGGIVPWCAYANNEVVNLLRKDDFARWISKIKSALGYLPDDPNKKIFRLNHKPGIGGTTILRLLAWELHKDYPVLVAEKYEKTVVRNLLQQLYDNQTKAFVVFADDEFEEVEELERDIKILPRPCVLIRAHRINTTVSNFHDFQLSAIKPEAEDALRYKFKKISELSSQILEAKDSQYDSFICQDLSMKSPFFIGLYYLEKEFQHLPEYVQQAFKGVYKDEEFRALGYIAFCDIYGDVSLPYIFINKILKLGRKNYLDNNPYVKSILFMGKVNGALAAYKSRHYLISREILNICSKKLFGGTYKDELAKWSNYFINDIMEVIKNNFDESYKIILEKVFTRNRNTEKQDDTDFSKLIQDISIPEYRIDILTKLAEESGKIAMEFDPQENRIAYMMAAHFYGHLGRLFSKGMSVINYEKAVKYSQKAKEFLEKCEGQDYTIYHMYAEAKRLALKDKCEEYLQSETEIASSVYNDLENETDDIMRQYDISDEEGNHVYARSSAIVLLKDYLKFVYRMKKINSVKDMYTLTDRQMQYKMQIEEILESLTDEDMNDKEKQYYQTLQDDFKSGIMYNDYAHMEEYHQNKLDYEVTHQGTISSIIMHRRKLIYAKIGRYRIILPNGKSSFLKIPAKELEKILKLLEQNFEQSIDGTNYQERKKRCNEYKLWMQLAKYSDRKVSVGITYVMHWANLSELGKVNDPLPYYYLSVLYSLSVLEGNVSDREKVGEYLRKAGIASSTRIGSITQIKDILIKGNGIGQLYDVSEVKDLGTLEVYRQMTPIVFTGKFKSVSSRRGIVDLKIPEKWRGREAKFSVGKNNHMTEDAVTHMVDFYAGFCYEGITAINSSIIDKNANEIMPEVVIDPTLIVQNEKEQTDLKKKKLQQSKQIPEGILGFVPLEKHAFRNGYLITGTVEGEKPAAIVTYEMPDYEGVFIDLEQFVDKILDMSEIPTVCIDINDKGQYILSMKKADITLDDLLKLMEKKLEKADRVQDNEKIKDQVQKSVNEDTENLPDINESVLLESFTVSRSEILGVFSYGGQTYKGKITTGLSYKKVSEVKKMNKIKCKVLQKNKKGYILRFLN